MVGRMGCLFWGDYSRGQRGRKKAAQRKSNQELTKPTAGYRLACICEDSHLPYNNPVNTALPAGPVLNKTTATTKPL